jgi:hypothetical protein
MKFDIGVPVSVCTWCKKQIKGDQRLTSVFVRNWNPRLGRFVGEGPFHAECGKSFNAQAETKP